MNTERKREKEEKRAATDAAERCSNSRLQI
jgi:hypothetical protein